MPGVLLVLLALKSARSAGLFAAERLPPWYAAVHPISRRRSDALACDGISRP
jgi:hypothetical protein